MSMNLSTAAREWLDANEAAVNEAAKCITKKGYFNPPLEKPWPEYEALKVIANEKWYKMKSSKDFAK